MASLQEKLKSRSPSKVAKIDGLSKFIAQIVESSPRSNIRRCYRGHSSTKYKLLPSLFRNSKDRPEEKNIFRELISMHPSEFADDKNVFEQLVRMQHFSLKTRLLDVTFNPLVALYFAVNSQDNEDGEVIIFDTPKNKVKYFDSDTVSCIANLSNLKSMERNQLREITEQNALNTSTPAKRLLQFIRAEKPYFLSEIVPNDLHRILLVKPRQNNRRILAQQGAFFLFGLAPEIHDGDDDIKVTRIKIAAKDKKTIVKELDIININGSTLFPEIESAAKYLISKLPSVSTEPTDLRRKATALKKRK